MPYLASLKNPIRRLLSDAGEYPLVYAAQYTHQIFYVNNFLIKFYEDFA
ncbi:hypothetical protein [Escherichia phage vB_EcoM_BL]